MCGIFALSSTKNNSVGNQILQGLKKLEYRGYDSWGIATREEEKILFQKTVGKISDSSQKFSPTFEGMGHSRWATHGGVTKENSHPHQYKDITVVHNGIFENYLSEKKRLEEKGEIFTSQTDSEVIAHLIQEEVENGKNLLLAVRAVSQKISGRFAILVMQSGELGKEAGIVCARRGSPLIIGRGEEETYIASDIPAFLSQTSTVNYLDDDEIAVVRGSEVDFFSIPTGEEIVKRDIVVPWKEEFAEKGEFDHFMMKEIFDQKSSLSAAINHSDEDIDEFIKTLQSANGVYLIACGTAHKMSWAAEYFFASVSGRKINVVPASEMPVFEQFVNERTALVAVSQSGETADVLEILERGKKRGAKILSLTNVESSSIARISEKHLPLNVGIEKAVASTKASTGQMALLLLLAYADANKLNQGRQVLQNLSSNVNDLINPRYEKKVKEVAEKFYHAKNIFIIGRNSLFPMALESAIKIMEVSYIHAQGFAAGEMKHGPIALIEKDSPVIVLGGDEETVSNAMELKSRGAKIIGIAPENAEVFDEWLKVPNSGQAQPIASLVPVQILSYYLATLLQLDPDMPRNLAKSVTVK
jgi:glucosamine--fructose-6-phosphate aminotransferase (isomerizing)